MLKLIRYISVLYGRIVASYVVRIWKPETLVMVAVASALAFTASHRARAEAPQTHRKVKSQTYQQWRASLPADYPTTRDYSRMLAKWVGYCETKGYWDGSKLTGPQGRDLTLNYAMALACLVGGPHYDPTINGLSRAELKSRLNIAVANMPVDPGKTLHVGAVRFAAIVLLVAGKDLTSKNADYIMKNILAKREQLYRGNPHASSRAYSKARATQTPSQEGWVEHADKSAESDSWIVGAKSLFLAFYLNHSEHDQRFYEIQHDWVELLCTLDMKDNTTMVGTPAKPLNQWTSGANFNADYTFDNHFPFHTGYMYDSLETMGLVWTVYKHKGHPIPNTFYWNEKNIYDHCLCHFHLWDGRNFYPTGTDWSMYLYGVGEEMSYYAARKFIYNDKVAASIERGIAASYEWRQKHFDGDLSGFSKYTNHGGLFGDCVFDIVCADFPNLILGPWKGGFATEAELNARARGNFRSWVSRYTITNRTDHRLAKAGEKGWAVIPCNGDHMGIWEGSRVAGTDSGSVVGNFTGFDGGFVSTKTSCFAALPDGKSVLIMEQGDSSQQTWNIGNWIFNNEKRTVYHAGGSTVYDRTGKSGLIPSSWINVDNKIAYIDMESRSDVFSASEADLAPRKNSTFWPGRYIGYVEFKHDGRGLLIVANVPAAQTQAYANAGRYELMPTDRPDSGAAVLLGQDGASYLVLSNFSKSGQTIFARLPFAPTSYESITGERLCVEGKNISASLTGYTTGVFRLTR